MTKQKHHRIDVIQGLCQSCVTIGSAFGLFFHNLDWVTCHGDAGNHDDPMITSWIVNIECEYPMATKMDIILSICLDKLLSNLRECSGHQTGDIAPAKKKQPQDKNCQN